MLLAEGNVQEQVSKQVEELADIHIEEVEPSVIMETLKGYVPDIINFGIAVLLAIVVFAIGTNVIKVIRKIVRRSLERSSADEGVEQFIDSMLKIGLYIVLVMIVAGMVGIQTTSIVAVVGSAGVAVGLALQGSLSNFAGVVLILLLKPFKVGDYIVDCADNNEGTVMQIQVFYTKLLTIDNKEILIPNGTLMNSSIINATGQTERRIDILVGIAYDADLKTAKQCIEQLIAKEEKVLKEKPVDIFVNSLSDSAVELGLHVWVATQDYWSVRWRLTENIKLAFDEQGIEIPFNQLSVHIMEKEK